MNRISATILSLLFLLLNTSQLNAQVVIKGTANGQVRTEHIDYNIYEAVEISPAPKMGMDAFKKWVVNNYQYPAEAIEAKVKGKVIVSFVVEKDGTLTDIRVLKDLGHGTGQAAINLFKRAAKWNPGIQNGRPVRVAYVFPIPLDVTEMANIQKDTSFPIAPGQSKVVEISELPQNTSNLTSSNQNVWNGDIYDSAEINPEPTGGMAIFRKWMADNYQYPAEAIKAKVKGTVTVSFVVERNGQLTDFKVLKDPGFGTGEAAINLLKRADKWVLVYKADVLYV